MELIKSLRLDWLAVEIPWSTLYPEPAAQPDWTALDGILNAAAKTGTAVMLSISAPPTWALAKKGPDPDAAANLISTIVQRNPVAIQAAELITAANTVHGWGARPDPAAYMDLYNRVNNQLIARKIHIFLVVGGLEISPALTQEGDWSAQDFLKRLYLSAGNTPLPLVGLRMTSIQGEPSTPPLTDRPPAFRQYETIRAMMDTAGRSSERLWITYLDFGVTQNSSDQTAWLIAAYAQARSQLYIGAAFLEGLNSCPTSPDACREVSMLSSSGEIHPFGPALRGILARNAPLPSEIIPGRAKSELLRKPR